MVCYVLGTVIRDVREGSWILGRPVGSGAFGDVYLACRGDAFNKDKAGHHIYITGRLDIPARLDRSDLVVMSKPGFKFPRTYKYMYVQIIPMEKC